MSARQMAGALLPALALALLLPASAAGQSGTMPDWANKNGAFGIGGNTTLGGVNGLNIRTYVTPQFGLHLTFGFGLEHGKDDTGGSSDYELTQSTLSAAVYGAYKMAYWQRGHLSVIFGVDSVKLSDSFTSGGVETTNDASDLLIGLGLQSEWFPTQYLSLFLQVGLTLDFIGEDELNQAGIYGADFADPGVSGIELNLGGDLLGSAGFTVWFK